MTPGDLIIYCVPPDNFEELEPGHDPFNLDNGYAQKSATFCGFFQETTLVGTPDGTYPVLDIIVLAVCQEDHRLKRIGTELVRWQDHLNVEEESIKKHPLSDK